MFMFKLDRYKPDIIFLTSDWCLYLTTEVELIIKRRHNVFIVLFSDRRIKVGREICTRLALYNTSTAPRICLDLYRQKKCFTITSSTYNILMIFSFLIILSVTFLLSIAVRETSVKNLFSVNSKTYHGLTNRWTDSLYWWTMETFDSLIFCRVYL